MRPWVADPAWRPSTSGREPLTAGPSRWSPGRVLARALRPWATHLLLLTIAACGGDPLDRLAESGSGRVAAALPGGLIRLEDGSVVRLSGVDLPGRGEPGWAETRAELAKSVEGRAVILLQGGPRRDGFGRRSGHLRIQDGRRWVQGALLEAGWARVRTASDDRALAREMLAREARARVAGRGLWSWPAWRVRLPGEAEPGFMLVEGRLGPSAPPDGGRRALHFIQPGLALDLRGRVRDDLAAAGLAPARLEGRLVRVRGVIRRTGAGLVMTLDHPEQIEVLQDHRSARRQ